MFSNKSSRMLGSTNFGKVTSSLGSFSMALVMAKVAPLFLAHDLLAIPLFTSHEIIESMFLSDSHEPSINIPNPPLTTSPQPTPPPLCKLTHVAPLNESPTKLCTAISAVNIDPS